ncbi:aldose epimerase family protein [Colwelliaceae bacterium MEBiC 14330]
MTTKISASAQSLATICLSNEQGMRVEIINFGARVKSIKFPVNNNLLSDNSMEMILGYDNAEDYLADDAYLGATCGRVCNRIAGGKFEILGKVYQLPLNDGENCLHGGPDNFAMRIWQIDKVSTSSVTLSLVSHHGDQGFPGTLKVLVTYQLTADNKLIINFCGNSDAITPVNLTNHAYFNLGEKDCQSLYLQLMSSTLLATDDAHIPTGDIIEIAGTDFSFTKPACIGERQQNIQEKSLTMKNGYNHCFVLDDSPFEQPKAILTSVKNRIRLSIYTDQTSIQFYTGYYLQGQFSPYQGACLEAQNYTDAEIIPTFPVIFYSLSNNISEQSFISLNQSSGRGL